MSFATKPAKEKRVSEGCINLQMPNAGWDSETCTDPAEPTKNNTYYDYTIYLQPKVYTVKAGHTLKLNIMSIVGEYVSTSDYEFVDDNIGQAGHAYRMASKYQFTIDNKSSYAELPVLKQ